MLEMLGDREQELTELSCKAAANEDRAATLQVSSGSCCCYSALLVISIVKKLLDHAVHKVHDGRGCRAYVLFF